MIKPLTSPEARRLTDLLVAREGVLRVALSGGIDSLTLMTLAARVRTGPTIAMHAVSAAVPDEATQRCRQLAERFGWSLKEIDAEEFSNPAYVSNPVNRCYHCKSSLFDRIIASVEAESGGVGTIATGTNADDLGDYRPGLTAARERNVWQPYVEAGVDKKTLRRIAAELGLGALADLPAQPCLSSRVETGISINVDDLRFVHKVERQLTALTEAGDIRCRITEAGVVVQLPADNSAFTDAGKHSRLVALTRELCASHQRHYLGIEQYRMGSAFLRADND